MFRPHPFGCRCAVCFVQPPVVCPPPVVTTSAVINPGVPIYGSPYTMFGGAPIVEFGIGGGFGHEHGHTFDHGHGGFGHGHGGHGHR